MRAYPCSTAVFSTATRSTRCSALTTACRLFYDEHWARFQNSASLIRMNIGLTLAQLTEEIRATIETTGAPELGLDVYVRYMVTRGEGPVDLFPAPELRSRYVVVVREVPKWNPIFYSHGVKAAIAGTRRNPGNALDPNIKGGNYLNNVLGVMDARAHGADECLMLNEAELVTEASNSNVFFVIRGELVTPAQTAANLRGLTKAAVHSACTAQGTAEHRARYSRRGAARRHRVLLDERDARGDADRVAAPSRRRGSAIPGGWRVDHAARCGLLPRARRRLFARARAFVVVLRQALRDFQLSLSRLVELGPRPTVNRDATAANSRRSRFSCYASVSTHAARPLHADTIPEQLNEELAPKPDQGWRCSIQSQPASCSRKPFGTPCVQ